MCARVRAELKGRALVIELKKLLLLSQDGENIRLHC